jgi:hypothetical protein
MNLAGLLPVVVPMLGEGQLPVTGAFSQIVSLIIAYASAAFGWTLVVVLPTVAEAIDRALILRARNTLHEAQRRLVEDWGSDVRGPLPLPPAGLPDARTSDARTFDARTSVGDALLDDGVLHRLLQLFEGAHLDLPNPLTRDAIALA